MVVRIVGVKLENVSVAANAHLDMLMMQPGAEYVLEPDFSTSIDALFENLRLLSGLKKVSPVPNSNHGLLSR